MNCVCSSEFSPRCFESVETSQSFVVVKTVEDPDAIIAHTALGFAFNDDGPSDGVIWIKRIRAGVEDSAEATFQATSGMFAMNGRHQHTQQGSLEVGF